MEDKTVNKTEKHGDNNSERGREIPNMLMDPRFQDMGRSQTRVFRGRETFMKIITNK